MVEEGVLGKRNGVNRGERELWLRIAEGVVEHDIRTW